jgi:DNA-binding MarR family transcriptional regulator
MTGRNARSRRRLKQSNYRLLADFRHLLRQFLVFSEQQATDVGLTPQQHQALLAVKGHRPGAPSVGDLAARLAIRHNSAVGLVDRLARSGLLLRRRDPADRRRVTLKLTGQGEVVLRKLTASHRAELRRLAPLLKPLLAQLHD